MNIPILALAATLVHRSLFMLMSGHHHAVFASAF